MCRVAEAEGEVGGTIGVLEICGGPGYVGCNNADLGDTEAQVRTGVPENTGG